MSIRRMPMVGDQVTITYLATELSGVVHSVEEEGRSLTVTAQDGQDIRFRLNRAIGRFTENGELTGARLRFVTDDD